MALDSPKRGHTEMQLKDGTRVSIDEKCKKLDIRQI